ncbi:MAG: peptidoglycan DD-metalloendopeptidase family protein [Alphaproteobacteria bacterium]
MSKQRHSLLLTSAIVVWLGCHTALAAPAPVLELGTKAPSPSGVVTVRKGDTLSSLAKLYRVTPEGLAAANNLAVFSSLPVGQRLILPAPSMHKVGDHDTLYSISRMYNVPLETMAAANRLKPPYTLVVGQVLRLPDGETIIETETPAPQKKASTTVKSLGTLKIASAPKQKNGPVTYNGVKMLKAPGPSEERKTFDSMLSRLAGIDPPKEGDSDENLLRAPEPETPKQQIVDYSRTKGFIWPVKGRVISGYGPKDGGLYNDGINIAAPRGTPVLSAADGAVAYVGDSLKSYGNLVLVRHPGGMVTAYAHLNNVTVKPGMTLKKGQPIGTVGSTGAVANAQLHFEVRRGSATLNPREYLG